MAESMNGSGWGKKAFVAINLVGGPLVLGSYWWGVTAPAQQTSLWGAVPADIQPLYTANMFVAAAGYFFFSHYILRHLDGERVRIPGLGGFAAFNICYFAILIPSALWLPLTRWMIDAPGPGRWAAVLAVLWTTAAGSLGVLWGVAKATPQGAKGRTLAILGALGFCLQTVILDAILWPLWFNG